MKRSRFITASNPTAACHKLGKLRNIRFSWTAKTGWEKGIPKVCITEYKKGMKCATAPWRVYDNLFRRQLSMYHWNLSFLCKRKLPQLNILSVNFYQITQSNILEDSHLHIVIVWTWNLADFMFRVWFLTQSCWFNSTCIHFIIRHWANRGWRLCEEHCSLVSCVKENKKFWNLAEVPGNE